jgi:hypothetical protein
MEGRQMAANGLTRGERLQIMLSPEELAAIDDFRFRHRMPSRAAAVRELMGTGLRVIGTEAAAAGSKSVDFGVLEDRSINKKPKPRYE